jgi:ABC-type transporter Mla MlaB component
MELYILHTLESDVYILKERVSRMQVFEIQNYFKTTLVTKDAITIDLSQVDDVDVSGAQMLIHLKAYGKALGKSVRMLGATNNRIKGAFRLVGAPELLEAA